MINEFKRVTLACVGSSIAPSGAGYPDTLGPNQVCTLQGSTPGNPDVPGADYISAAFNYEQSTQWRNWGITIVFFVGFAIMQMLAMEFFKHGRGAPAIQVYQPENKERKALNEKLLANKEKFRKGEAEQDLSSLTTSKKPFTWSNVTYDVPVSGGQRRLLNSVFGYVKPGTLTALMGSSGAGVSRRAFIGEVRPILMHCAFAENDSPRCPCQAKDGRSHRWRHSRQRSTTRRRLPARHCLL